MNLRRFLAIIVLAGTLTSAAGAVFAVRPDEMLSDPALEARAREISRELRCLVCQNESIDDSDADLAHDLRMLVRRRLKAGDSDEQAKQYIVGRYGDYVLLKPPLEANTLVLWLGPAVLFLCAILAAVLFYRHRDAVVPMPLSPAEQEKLDKLLRHSGKDDSA